jgi:phosphohistidine phosphatase SixA
MPGAISVRRVSLGVLLAQTICALAIGSVDAADPVRDRSLVDRLRQGGYVLYVRHFSTDPTQKDTDPFHLENIAAQRNLTDEGREQAAAVGESLRALTIPVGSVVCSQFHRAHESAKLLAVGDPSPTPDVSAPASAANAEEKERRAKALRGLLSTPPAPGKNTVIVSHNSNLQSAAGEEFASIREGEVIVFEPAGETFRMVDRVYPPSKWSEWSAKAP